MSNSAPGAELWFGTTKVVLYTCKGSPRAPPLEADTPKQGYHFQSLKAPTKRCSKDLPKEGPSSNNFGGLEGLGFGVWGLGFRV